MKIPPVRDYRNYKLMKPRLHYKPLIPGRTIKAHRLAAQYCKCFIGDTTEASAVTCTRCLFLWFVSFGQAKEMNKSQIGVARGKLFSSTYVFRRLLRRYASHNDVLDGDSILVPNKHPPHETPITPYTIVIQFLLRPGFFHASRKIYFRPNANPKDSFRQVSSGRAFLWEHFGNTFSPLPGNQHFMFCSIAIFSKNRHQKGTLWEHLFRFAAIFGNPVRTGATLTATEQPTLSHCRIILLSHSYPLLIIK